MAISGRHVRCVVQQFDPAFRNAMYASFGAKGLIKYFQTCNRVNATALYSYTVLGQLYLQSLQMYPRPILTAAFDHNLLVLRYPRVK
jgi:hypothetical protein